MTTKRALRRRIAELEEQLRIEQNIAAFWKWLHDGGEALLRELDQASAEK